MRLRRKLTHRINRSVAWRVEDQIGATLTGLQNQLDELGRHVRSVADRGAELDERLGELERRVHGVAKESAWAANELARLAPQAAAFEERLEQLVRPTVLTGPLEDLPEARLLLDVVREEHARVRARLSLVSAYEERLRRLEREHSPSDS